MSRNITVTKPLESDAEKALRKTDNGKLIFTAYQDRMCAFLIYADRLRAMQVLEEMPSKIGAIYIAKVKNVVKNIDACFVEIADGEICFLPLREANVAFLLNRSVDGRILEGDELLVQVVRDAQKTKQASVTTKISLANDAFAISLGDTRIGYSGKLSKDEKQRVSDFLDAEGLQKKGHLIPWKSFQWKNVPWKNDTEKQPSPYGLVVRTLAKDLSPEELSDNLNAIKEQWDNLFHTALHRTCFSCLKEAEPGFVAVLKQLVYSYEYEEILTDDDELFLEIQKYCSEHLPEKLVRHYQDNMLSLGKLYGLDSKADMALGTRVWLKSGGYLVIEPTEAMTVIDVNSGKYEAGKGTQETAFRINCEAAEEIALQLRLRNLSGMILVDFINMDSKEREEQLLQQLKVAVRGDKQKTNVIDMTALGLVEITRKKSYKPLREQLI